jgi:hypothetical protein
MMALDLTSLYQQSLGRAPDAGGLQYWQSLLDSGTMSPEQVKTAFYNSAAKEVQRDDTGLNAATDAYDERRIADAMALYNDNPKLASLGGYFANAGDTRTQTAAQRLGGFDITKPQQSAPRSAAAPAVPPPATGGFNPAATTFGDPFKYDQKNPYLQQMATGITSQINENLTRNIMPQIASGAQQVGGFGGSRQGVVEANALNDANKQAANALTGMYYGDYNNAMNRQLQKYGQDQGYNLGMGNLQLGNRNADMNQMQLGANLFQQGNAGTLGQGQGMYNLGLTSQQAPWQAYQNFGNVAQPYTGFGSTTGTSADSPAAGFMGGAVGASQLYNIYK